MTILERVGKMLRGRVVARPPRCRHCLNRTDWERWRRRKCGCGWKKESEMYASMSDYATANRIIGANTFVPDDGVLVAMDERKGRVRL